MENFYDWKPEYTVPFVAIMSVSIGFAVYWFLSLSKKIERYVFNKYAGDEAWINFVVFQKLCGVLFMGLIPGIFVLLYSDHTLNSLGINLNNFTASLIYILIIGAIMLTANYFVAKNPFNLNMYPQMRIMKWSKKIVLINSLAWAAYLFSYEFMYRGILLITCVEAFGFWPAVAINLSFYSATHIAKGQTETVGTFPYGLVLCFITISTGSILVAFVTHLILALSNDYYAVHHNPEMKFV